MAIRNRFPSRALNPSPRPPGPAKRSTTGTCDPEAPEGPTLIGIRAASLHRARSRPGGSPDSSVVSAPEPLSKGRHGAPCAHTDRLDSESVQPMRIQLLDASPAVDPLAPLTNVPDPLGPIRGHAEDGLGAVTQRTEGLHCRRRISGSLLGDLDIVLSHTLPLGAWPGSGPVSAPDPPMANRRAGIVPGWGYSTVSTRDRPQLARSVGVRFGRRGCRPAVRNRRRGRGPLAEN